MSKNKISMSIATKNQANSITYAILEEKKECVYSLKEKPNFNYKINTGIYLFDKKLIDVIPENTYFDVTDFISKLIESKKKIKAYNFYEKWVDIGTYKDYNQLHDEK